MLTNKNGLISVYLNSFLRLRGTYLTIKHRPGTLLKVHFLLLLTIVYSTVTTIKIRIKTLIDEVDLFNNYFVYKLQDHCFEKYRFFFQHNAYSFLT